MPTPAVLAQLRHGVAIPAHPLALTAQRKLDERRQRALTRYYLAAGAGGVAVGVHSTQFEIRKPEHGLLGPVLALAIEELRRHEVKSASALVKVAGVCGDTSQATREAQLAAELGYDMALLSLAALRDADDDRLIEHCKEIAQVIPLVGFYLQPSVGGRVLGVEFWRRFAAIENVVAIKMAPFNRYQTLDVVRAVAEAGRALSDSTSTSTSTSGGGGGAEGIALYTGNDDNIVADLLGRWTFTVAGTPPRQVTQRIVGGLLGHWAYWTRSAVQLLARVQEVNTSEAGIPAELMLLNRQVTDMNSAVFDPAHNFRGCIPGMHEVLRRQGLLAGTWCLDPHESLSPGQAEELTRVGAAYPHLVDDEFVARGIDEWMK